MLILSGEEDPVGYYGERVKKLYELYKNEGLNVQMKLYPEMRHEILNEKTQSMYIVIFLIGFCRTAKRRYISIFQADVFMRLVVKHYSKMR